MSARLPILIGLTLILAACGSTGTTTGGSVESELEGRAFVSTAVSQGGAAYDLVPGSVVRLTFGDGRLSANAGCNTLGGAVAFDGSGMTVTSALASTQMACPQELMDQDTWLAALLTAGSDLTVDGDLLTLASGNTTMVLQDERTAVPDASLVMTEWTLDTIIDGDAATSVPAGVPATLAFGSGLPKAFVETGCNNGSGSVETGENTLTFGPIALTKKACADDAAAAVESAVLSVLQGEVAYVIDGKALTITRGEQSLVYRAP
ncbi:MAG TPA: META domain-containing protein [Candidatus Limnocylindria bacterium]|nr:META domain-containing protein [Candidatus Limnocylindria bacterium]